MKATKKNSKSVTITKRDFDNAVKRPWDARTCIIAQTGKRVRHLGGKRLDNFICRITRNDRAAKLMRAFDKDFAAVGDEQKAALRELRAKLPVKIILS